MENKKYVLIEDLDEKQFYNMYCNYINNYCFVYGDFLGEDTIENNTEEELDILLEEAIKEHFEFLAEDYTLAMIDTDGVFLMEDESYDIDFYDRYLFVNKKLEARKLRRVLNKQVNHSKKAISKI